MGHYIVSNFRIRAINEMFGDMTPTITIFLYFFKYLLKRSIPVYFILLLLVPVILSLRGYSISYQQQQNIAPLTLLISSVKICEMFNIIEAKKFL